MHMESSKKTLQLINFGISNYWIDFRVRPNAKGRGRDNVDVGFGSARGSGC